MQAAILGRINPMMGTFGGFPMENEGLNLLAATVTAPAGLAMKVPALQVQLASVNAWWAARHFSDGSSSRGGSAVFVGTEMSFCGPPGFRCRRSLSQPGWPLRNSCRPLLQPKVRKNVRIVSWDCSMAYYNKLQLIGALEPVVVVL